MYKEANSAMKDGGVKEERLMLLEQWSKFEVSFTTCNDLSYFLLQLCHSIHQSSQKQFFRGQGSKKYTFGFCMRQFCKVTLLLEIDFLNPNFVKLYHKFV